MYVKEHMILVMLCVITIVSIGALYLSAFNEHISSCCRNERIIKPCPITSQFESFKTTCSHDADRRGPHQQLFSFSLYGNLLEEDVSRRYLKPLKETIEHIYNSFPGTYCKNIKFS